MTQWCTLYTRMQTFSPTLYASFPPALSSGGISSLQDDSRYYGAGGVAISRMPPVTPPLWDRSFEPTWGDSWGNSPPPPHPSSLGALALSRPPPLELSQEGGGWGIPRGPQAQALAGGAWSPLASREYSPAARFAARRDIMTRSLQVTSGPSNHGSQWLGVGGDTLLRPSHLYDEGGTIATLGVAREQVRTSSSSHVPLTAMT